MKKKKIFMTLTFNLTLLSVVIFMQQLLKMFVKICFSEILVLPKVNRSTSCIVRRQHLSKEFSKDFYNYRIASADKDCGIRLYFSLSCTKQ